MTDVIRVLIADDHTIVRAGIRLLLDMEPNFEVVGEAVNGREAVALAEQHRPDVVLMDIAMPVVDGIEATRQIKGSCPTINVLVLTMHRSDEYLFEMLKAGASGYLIKGAETEELIQAIRTVAKGEVFLYPAIAGKLVQQFLYLSGTSQAKKEEQEKRANYAGQDPPPTTNPLSPRESEIMKLLAEGYSNKEIAAKLVISLSTVYTHRSKLMEKLNLSSRYDLMKYARENGLIQD